MTDLLKVKKTIEAASYHGQYLNYEVFVGIKFVRCDFRHVDAKLASFRNCTFVDCQFDNGNFQLTKFTSCRFVTSSELKVIRNASFGSTQFLGCDIFRGGCWFNECSLRNSQFRNCHLGEISFRASSLEAADIRRCKIDEINIAFTSCTGLVFDQNETNKVIFSTPTMFLIVGGWNLLAASRPVLRDTIGGDDIEDVNELISIRELLKDQLSREIKQNKSIWRIASGLVSLSYDPSVGPSSLEAIVSTLIPEIRQAEISEQQLLDELILTLKLFFLVSLFDKRFSLLCGEISNTFADLSSEIHPEVWTEFSKLARQYDLATDRVHSIRIQFARLDASEPSHVIQAAQILRKFVDLIPTEGGANQLQVRQGSIVLEVLASLNQIPWWVAAAICVGIGSKVTINIDINQLFSQISGALGELRAQKQKQVSELRETIEQQEVRLVIADLYLENSDKSVLVTLPTRLRIQGAQGEKGIQLVADGSDVSSH